MACQLEVSITSRFVDTSTRYVDGVNMSGPARVPARQVDASLPRAQERLTHERLLQLRQGRERLSVKYQSSPVTSSSQGPAEGLVQQGLLQRRQRRELLLVQAFEALSFGGERVEIRGQFLLRFQVWERNFERE